MRRQPKQAKSIAAAKPTKGRSRPVVVLDTYHLSALSRDGPSAERLTRRLNAAREEVTTTVVNVQERVEGWLKEIHATPDPLR